MLDNPRANKIKQLTKLLRKKNRKERNEFLVEGPQAVRELLTNATKSAIEVFIETSKLQEIYELAKQKKVKVTEVNPAVISALSDTVQPQGVVAHAKTTETSLNHSLKNAKLAVILNEIRDPGNAGTILRVADAAGADVVIFAGDSIDPWHPKVVRSTTGSLFHIPVVQDVTLFEVLKMAGSCGLFTIAADVRGEDLNPRAEFLRNPTAWVFGNEAHGLESSQRNACDAVIKLPIFGKAESLNLATAAAVCIYSSAFALQQPSA